MTVTRVHGSTLFVERRDKQVVQIDTRSEHGSQIQHAYAHTEYREQGKNRYAELQMVDSLVHQRSLTVGMTFQVSDPEVTSTVMRATILRHALLAYLFGVVIIGIVINVVAGLTK